MADEIQGRINCGESWWPSSARSMVGSSLCTSSGAIDVGGFGWKNDHDHLLEMNIIRSSGESSSAPDGSVVLQDVEKPHLINLQYGTGNNMSMDSTLHMMSNGLNQALFQSNEASECNYSAMLQEDLNSSMNSRQESGMDCRQTQKQRNPKIYANANDQHYSTDTFEPVNQRFASYTHPSNLQQNLFDTTPQPQISLFESQSMNNFASTTSNYLTSLTNFSPPLPKFSPMLKQQSPIAAHQLQFSNNTSLFNASAAALNEIRASLLPSSTIGDKLNRPNITAKSYKNEEVARRTNIDEPALKRQRIETLSPLPTFKVRKEKLGDRITALQQLVSPFGKTDTASVLHEAIEYIKFLHDQVSLLSTPYLKNGTSDIQRQQPGDKLEDQDGPRQDLRSRGLCLVPISSTSPVAIETATDFWTPTFGGAFSRQKGEAIQHLRTQLISY